MKENSLDSHRGKVAESKAVAAAIRSESTASTNFDDDYNEWELGIGDLIIDLDADIEKNNEKQGTNQGNSNNSTGTTTNTVGNSNNTGVVNANSIGTTTTTANSQLHHHHHHHHQQQQSQPATGALQQSNFAMSSGKKQLNNGASGGGGGSGTGSGGGGTSIEHQATVDKGLKMKIKRTKPTKTSEAKHEIVKSDTKPNSPLETMNGTTGSGAATGTTASSGSASSSSTASATSAASASGTSGTETGNSAGGGGGKSKHASSKGRGGSHREKKERTKDKERDKDRGGNAKVTAIDVNGVLGPSGCSITSPTIKLANSTINVASLPTPTVNLGVPANVAALGLSAATVNGAGSSSTSGSGANGSSATSGSSTTANIGASGNTNACGTSGSSSVVANSGGATGAAAVTNAAGFGSNSGSNIANGGGSAPSAGVASLATAAVTPPSSINVKLEPKFPNVPISNFASIKLEDNLRSGSGIPAKRMRISVDKNTTSTADVKVERSTSPKPPEMHDMCVGTSVGTITEPECLGPCEPGTTVTLEGIVWQETEGGVLVVNVTWRGKTYVGTLLDCTKHDWAPPRFCESPTSDVESRTPKGRGKRGRANANATTIDPSNFTETRSSMHSKLRNAGKGRRTNNSGFTAPPSPAKAPESSPAAGVKRKGRPAELELPSPTEPKSSKRSRSQSRGTPTNPTPIEQQPSSPILIECPEPNCSKKYKHINGLRYHQTHAHHSNAGTAVGIEDSPDEQAMKDVSSENDESTQESVPQSPGVASSSSSSDKTHRSSPRPFTGKVPPPPPTSDQKPAVPTLPANGSGPVEGETAAANAAAPTPPPPPPPLECPPSSTPSSDLGTLAAVAVSDSKAPASKGPATGSGGGVLRYGQSNGGSSTSPVGSQCQTAEVSSAMTSPPVGASSKVTSPSSSSTLPVIIPCRATSPVPATAAPLALSPTPHQSPRHTAAVSSQAAPPPPAAQLQPQPPQTTASSQPPLAPIYHHHHHHHHPFTHPGSEPLIAECPPGAGVVLPSQPSAAARSTTGTPNGPSSHPLSPSIACGTVVGPSSPHTLSDRSKVKQEKADKYRLKVMTASPSSIPRTATPPSAAAVPSPSSSSTSSKSSLTGSTPPLLNLQPGMGGSVGGAVPSLPIAATLKPLQPKPTLLGDSPGVSGPLTVDGIKKEKSKHRRKNKDRDRERKLSASYSGAGGPVGLHGTADLGGALHAAAGLDPQDKLNGSVYAKMTDLLGKDGVSRLSSSDLPLDLNTSSADNGSTCNENVQSPAYSDISDANDTTPGLEPEVTCKDIKEDSKVKGSAEQNPTATAHNLSPYGGYPYYGQSPYVVSPMSTQSPPVSRQPTNADRGIKEEVPVGGVDKMPEEKSSSKEVASKHWSERSRSGDRVVDVPERVPANGGQLMPPTSHSSSDYQLQQQKLMQQQYAYSYNYSYHYMEQAYHHHMHLKASESSYKHHHHHHQQVAPPQQQHHQYGSAVADDKDRLAIAYKEQVERQKEQLTGREKCQKDGKMMDDKVGGGGSSSELAKQMAASQSLMTATKDRDSHHSQRTSQHGQPSVHQPGSKVEALSASLKEKQNENHQILKENIELKTQMDKSKSNYERYEASMMYHHAQRNEELMRYLMYHEKADGPKGPEDLQRKDDSGGAKHGDAKAQGTSKDSPKPSVALAPASHGTSRAASSPKTAVAAAAVGGPKDCKDVASSGNKKDGAGDKTSDAGPTDATKDKKETRVQEGQKPTMETQGPPPPTNSYAYMHSPYMQPAHYGPLTYDPTHSMYRGMNPMLMTAAGHYPGPTYLHPQMRYVTAPAGDPQTELANKLHPTKALDLLQHHASQYYATSHKIHELQEHAIKSPVGSSSQAVTVSSTKLTDSAAAAAAAINKNDPMCVGNHERRSPPLQRHLHTHHHTHVGVGYPILRQYDPYGAMIASQQSVAASSVMPPFPAK